MEQVLKTPSSGTATIDDVISELEFIIAQCEREHSSAGYFAVLYHRVTCRIKEGIVNGEFEDGKRMELLDVLFAQRYISAWHLWKENKGLSRSWHAAFDASGERSTILMQHLLLGINAHINLDLGIAAVETMEGYALPGIQKDFDGINSILAGLVDEVQDKIARISPLMFLVDILGRGYDECLVRFSINTARAGAWRFAKTLAAENGAGYQKCISDRDEQIEQLAHFIARPRSGLLRFAVRLVSWFEPRDAANGIRLLKANLPVS